MSNDRELVLSEKKVSADKVASVFNTHWIRLHEQIEEMVQSKMNEPGVTEQTFINLAMPIFRSAVEGWKQAAKELDGRIMCGVAELLMTDRIRKTWGAEEGALGEQIKRYL